MRTRIRRRLTFANVCSFLALTVALGTGGAYAANTVFSADIVDGEVKAVDIGVGQVLGSRIADKTVKAADVADNAVTGMQILESSLAKVPKAVSADELGGEPAGAFQRACAPGTLLGYAVVRLSSLSTSNYSTQGIENDYMCMGGNVYAKRIGTGLARVVFHPTGQTGMFGALIGEFPMTDQFGTGADYLTSVTNGGNPGDPPPGYDYIRTYTVSVSEHDGDDANGGVRLFIF